MRVALIDLGSFRGEHNEPLGIQSICAYLSKHSLSADLYWYPLSDLTKIVRSILKYDIIGISITIGQVGLFEKIYRAIRSNNKPKLIIAGNTVPTFGYMEFLKKFPDVICVLGEGEEAFLNLVRSYPTSDNYSGITNIAYSSHGKIIAHPIKPVDLDKLESPIRPYLPFIINKGGISRIEGSRGCHWSKCQFCSVSSKYGNSFWRGFSLDKIISELQYLSFWGINSPYFTDEDFFGNDYDRINILSERIIRAKELNKISRQMNFFVSILAKDLVLQQGFESLKLFKRAGLREVFIGIETGCEQQIRRYKKKARTDQNTLAIERVKKLDLQLDTGYIMFDPYISQRELKSSFYYLKNLNLQKHDSRSIKSLRIQPGTPIESSYSDVITSHNYDLDNLTYDYKYVDPNVQSIVTRYSKWEVLFNRQRYDIQSASRGEILSENLRMEYKRALGYLRSIDFEFLESLLDLNDGKISYEDFNEKKKRLTEKMKNVSSNF